MTTRTFSCLVTAASFAMLPLIAAAGGEAKALDNCASAFVEHLKTLHPEATYRVAKPSVIGPSSASNDATGYVSRKHELTLTATETMTGKVLAMASCTTKRSGELVAMTSLPMDSARAQELLRLSARDTK
jgi:hypothetical protein